MKQLTFHKVDIVPESGLKPGGIYFETSTLRIKVAISETETEDYTDRVSIDENTHELIINGTTYKDLAAGTAKNLIGETEIDNSYMYRPTGGDSDVASGFESASVESIQGNAVAWNQMIENGNFENYSNWSTVNSSFSIVNGIVTVTNMAEDTANSFSCIRQINLPFVLNHVYLARIEYQAPETGLLVFEADYYGGVSTIVSKSTSWEVGYALFSPGDKVNNSANYSLVSQGYEHETKFRNTTLFDLSLIYGLGNEPTTPEQFETDYQRWFGRSLTYETYDSGSVRVVKGQHDSDINIDLSVKTVGFNLYDGGDFSGTTADWGDNILWKNDCGYTGKVELSFDFTSVANTSGGKVNPYIIIFYKNGELGLCGFYDNKSSGHNSYITQEGKTIDYIKSSFNEPGTLNVTNICVHFVWSGTRNGEYEPYWSENKPLPLDTLTGKLNGEGDSVVVFPDGIKRAGNIYDEILVENGITKAIKRVGSIDLGTLEWVNKQYSNLSVPVFQSANNCVTLGIGSSELPNFVNKEYIFPNSFSGFNTNDMCMFANSKNVDIQGNIMIRDTRYTDVTEFKTHLSGSILYYELAEPQTYVLDNFELPFTYRIDDFGTEQIVAPNNAIAPTLITHYGINAVDTIRNLSKNYINSRSEDNFLNKLSAATDSTWTKEWDEPTNSYKFKNTISAEEGQILTYKDGKVKWGYIDALDQLSYGVSWNDNTQSDPHLTRIGNKQMHKDLPIQSAYKGCVVKNTASGKAFQYYLDPNDWSKKADGTASVLDGTDGDVYVETPEFYGKSYRNNETGDAWVRISPYNIDGSWQKIPAMYIAAYRGISVQEGEKTVLRSIAKVVNLDTSATYDTIADVPTGSKTLSTFRTEARNNNDEILYYEYYKWVFYWNYVIEYANFNCQEAFKSSLTAEGYRQGGLGPGLTTISYNYWKAYNNCHALTPTGWSEVSGYSGNNTKVINRLPYTKTFTTPNTTDFVYRFVKDRVTGTINGNTATITQIDASGQGTPLMECYDVECPVVQTITVSGLTEANRIEGRGFGFVILGGGSVIDRPYSISTDGTYTIDWRESTKATRTIGIAGGWAGSISGINITITITSAQSGEIHPNILTNSFPRWRGFDNPFGDIYTFLDGIWITDNKVYTTTDPEKIQSTPTDENIKANYDYIGLRIPDDVTENGYIKSYSYLGQRGDIIGITLGGGAITYKCDYIWQNKEGVRVVFVGGDAAIGSGAGLGCVVSLRAPAAADAYIGARAFFLKK